MRTFVCTVEPAECHHTAASQPALVMLHRRSSQLEACKPRRGKRDCDMWLWDCDITDCAGPCSGFQNHKSEQGPRDVARLSRLPELFLLRAQILQWYPDCKSAAGNEVSQLSLIYSQTLQTNFVPRRSLSLSLSLSLMLLGGELRLLV